MATAQAYEVMAATALGELADAEGAFVVPEAEAKIADVRWPTIPRPVNPHHITAALNGMVSQGMLDATVEKTRGGREIKVFHRPVRRGLGRKIIDASARKRLLHTRYQAWASGSKAGRSGAIGPGLEIVVHRSLQEAAQFGYRLANPTSQTGEVRELFGQPTLGGSLDNGGWLTIVGPETFEPKPYLLLLEAKNLRQWIYPRTQELHQLLAKASMIQLAYPQHSLLPVLVCRRAHYLTSVMAEQLGFYVIQTQVQYVRPYLIDGELEKRQFDEVNSELAYNMVPFGDPSEPMVRHFRTPLQNVAERTASRWAVTGSVGGVPFTELRSEKLSYADRAYWLDQLATVCAEMHGEEMAWRTTQ